MSDLATVLGELVALRQSSFRAPIWDLHSARQELMTALRVAEPKLPADLVTWFLLHDGHKGIGKWFPKREGRAASFEEALEVRKKLLFKADLGADLTERRNWLPLISIGPSIHRTTCFIFDASVNALVERKSDDAEKYAAAKRAAVPLVVAVSQALEAWRAV